MGRPQTQRCSSTRILPSRGEPPAMVDLPMHVHVACSLCGADVIYRRRTYLAYLRRGIVFRCEKCLKVAHLARMGETIETTCSDCGKQYSAHKNQTQWKIRKGLPTYCPACRALRTGAAVRKANLIRHAQRREQDQAAGGNGNSNRTGLSDTWGPTPCGRTIRRACAGAGRPQQCIDCQVQDAGLVYFGCLSEAAKRFWPAWRFED